MMNNHEQDSRAVRLSVAIRRMRAALQDAAPTTSTGLSLSQVSILRRLRMEGPATAASLAAAEHVSHQAITQTLSGLKREGFVQATPDPQDGRKWLISVTDTGNNLFDAVGASRNAWLAQAIEATITESELPTLDKAIELLERLAAASNSGNSR